MTVMLFPDAAIMPPTQQTVSVHTKSLCFATVPRNSARAERQPCPGRRAFLRRIRDLRIRPWETLWKLKLRLYGKAAGPNWDDFPLWVSPHPAYRGRSDNPAKAARLLRALLDRGSLAPPPPRFARAMTRALTSATGPSAWTSARRPVSR